VCDFGSQLDWDPSGWNASPPKSPLDCVPTMPERPPVVLNADLSQIVVPATPAGQNGPAHCAPEASERRWCLFSCGVDSDCRTQDGFSCELIGTFGSQYVPRSLALATLPDGTTLQVPIFHDPTQDTQPKARVCVCTDPTLCYPTTTVPVVREVFDLGGLDMTPAQAPDLAVPPDAAAPAIDGASRDGM
jgi:hypothetical protein